MTPDANYLIATNGYSYEDSVNRLDTAILRMSLIDASSLDDGNIVINKVLSQFPNKNYLTVASAIMKPNII